MQTINILGSKLNIISKQELIEKAELVLAQNKKSFHFLAINPIKIIKSQTDQKLKQYIENADIIYPDAIGVTLAAKILYGIKLERITGYDFHYEILKICQKKRYPVYFLGTDEESLKTGIKKYNDKYPGLMICGFHNGYFNNTEFSKIILPDIIKMKPKLIIVAMGNPLQEKWIEKIRSKTIVPMMMGVGGSINTFIGKYPLGPRWIIKVGLLWLYRLIQQPRRYKEMYALPIFVLQIFKKKLNL